MTAAALVAPDAALAVLRRSDASMAEVMAALTTLDRSDAPGRTHTFGIASNITLDLLGTYVTASRKRANTSSHRSRSLPTATGVKGTSQYSCWAGKGLPRSTSRVCPGRSL